MLPPRWIRRIIIAPALILGTFLLVTTLPLWLLVGLALTSLVPGRFRIPRIIWMITFYLVWDSVIVLATFGLWLISGFGWKVRSLKFQRIHYILSGWFLTQLFRQARWVLRLKITRSGEGGSFAELLKPGKPIIVASRHAGHWDSFILIHSLLTEARREPRIVLKDTLQWDPAVDVMLNRLPNKFIAPAPFVNNSEGVTRARSSTAEEVGKLAARLDGNDAFVIFPEGGNFTKRRRRQRIEDLAESGQVAAAERANALEHVLAPRPGGINAALNVCDDADVVFVAHTGLDRINTLKELYQALPMDKELSMHVWRVPRSEIPTAPDERTEWLYDWFETINHWIDTHPSWEETPASLKPAKPKKRIRRQRASQ